MHQVCGRMRGRCAAMQPCRACALSFKPPPLPAHGAAAQPRVCPAPATRHRRAFCKALWGSVLNIAVHSDSTICLQGASQGGPPHGFMPAGGMVLPYHPAYSPYPQQVLYYPAGMTPYQQPLAGAQQWHPQRAPGMPGGGPQRGAGGPGAPAAMHAMQPMQAGGGYGMHLQAAYYYTNGGGMAPLTPAVSASQRQLPRAGSSSSASASSTGWGGVPLSQSAAEVLAAGAGPSPRSSPRHQQQSGGVGGPAAADAGAATAAAASTAAAAAAAASETAMRPQHQQHGGQPASAAAAPLPPAAAAPSAAHAPAAAAAGAAEPGLPSPAGPSSGSESCDEAGEASGGGPSSGGSSGDSRGSSSGGSSGGSRRSRGSRERQPCAFFLKTGTCAYGDRCARRFLLSLLQLPLALLSALLAVLPDACTPNRPPRAPTRRADSPLVPLPPRRPHPLPATAASLRTPSTRPPRWSSTRWACRCGRASRSAPFM